MKKTLASFAIAVAAAILGGCAGYRWTSEVPESLRTVAVPTFDNRTMSAELGSIVSQYVLREFQREGTFSIRRTGDSALEVQGSIEKATRTPIAYDRGYGMRASEYRYEVTASVSLVNKSSGEVLFENRRYVGETTFLTQNDLLTGQRDAAQRVANDIARQIVDDVVSYPYADSENGTGAVEGVQR